MSTEIEYIIDIIKSEYPGYSKSDIENAIIKYVETNIPEIISNIDLPEKSHISLFDKLKGFRENIQRRKLSTDSEKNNLIKDLESIQHDLKENHRYDSADILIRNMNDIDKSSSTYRLNIVELDTNIARIEHEMDDESNENDKTLKTLRDLTNDTK